MNQINRPSKPSTAPVLGGFPDLFEQAQPQLPSRWAGHRKRAFEGFRAKGIPNRRHEEWKYTGLKSLETGDFRIASQVSPDSVGKAKQLLDGVQAKVA